MRFGEELTSHLTPEWRKQYIDYNALKDILYKIEEQALALEGDARQREAYLVQGDELFFGKCTEELTRVDCFFSQKIAEAHGKLHELTRDLEVFKQMHLKKQQPLTTRSPLRFFRRSDYDQNLPKTAHQLRLAFSEFYLSLVLLQNYQQLNSTGFRKILKKRDKLLKNEKGLEWRQNRVEKAAYYLNHELDTLIAQIENTVIQELEGGDRSTGMKRLRVPPLSEKQSAWTTFRLGLYSGCFIVFVFLIIFSIYKSPHRQNEPKWVGVRLFRGFLMLCINIWLMGLNMLGWQKAGVNHVLIFEIDPRQHLTYQSLMEIGALFGMLWSLAVLGYLHAPSFNCSPLIFPLALMGVSLVYLFNPLKKPRCMHKSSRFWFVTHIFHCFTAPLHFVTFPDFWLADQMNSFVTFFVDMEYLVCFYAAEVDYSNRTMTVISIDQHANGVDFLTGNDMCSSNMYALRPLVSLLPPLIRFLQCWRRFRDTKKRHPHLTNAGKYASSFFIIIFGSLNTWYKGRMDDVTKTSSSPFFYLWILAYMVGFFYAYIWDVKMDWGLIDMDHKFLREELVYNHRWYYYGAIAGDFVLRLSWVVNVSLGDAWTIETELLLCITAPLECLRRFMWNYFRLENEHLNNCGQFRAVRDISVKPLRVGDEDDIMRVVDAADGATHRDLAHAAARKKRRHKHHRKLHKKHSKIYLGKWAQEIATGAPSASRRNIDALRPIVEEAKPEQSPEGDPVVFT